MAGFDFVAPFYDQVVRLVFGQKINNFNKRVLSDFKPVHTCLIIGGGTGQILLDAFEMKLASSYHYAELSSKMRAKAISRLSQEQIQSVEFSSDFPKTNSRYDIVVLPFVLDCYSESSIHGLLQKLEPIMTEQGKLLIVDFNHEPLSNYRPTFIQKQFIRLLYLFFRITTKIEAKKLPSILSILENSNFEFKSRNLLFDGWIVASNYENPNTERTE